MHLDRALGKRGRPARRAPTSSTEPMRGNRGSSGSSKPPGSAGACATRSSLGAARRPAGLALVRVVLVAEEDVGERHPERPVLHLPHMAELVRNERAVAEVRPRAKQDRPVRGVAVEAAEPREPEEPRRRSRRGRRAARRGAGRARARSSRDFARASATRFASSTTRDAIPSSPCEAAASSGSSQRLAASIGPAFRTLRGRGRRAPPRARPPASTDRRCRRAA